MIQTDSKEDFKRKAQDLQRYNKLILNQSSSDFKRICPSTDVLNKLWQFSVSSERRLFPEKTLNGSFLADMKLDFNKASKTKLCKVDSEATLKEEAWQMFFKGKV